VELEAIEPADGTIPSFSHPIKSPVLVYPAVMAYFQVCGIYKTDAPAFAKALGLQVEHKGQGHPALEFHEPVVGDQTGKKVIKVRANVVAIESLEVGELAIVEQDQDADDLGVRHLCLSDTAAIFFAFHKVVFDLLLKFNAKIIDRNEEFGNFISKHKRVVYGLKY